MTAFLQSFRFIIPIPETVVVMTLDHEIPAFKSEQGELSSTKADDRC
jgi:hypothetical protein